MNKQPIKTGAFDGENVVKSRVYNRKSNRASLATKRLLKQARAKHAHNHKVTI